MIQIPEGFDSIFRYVEVVSQRAQQIITGAKPRAESRASKPTLQARDDVDAGCVEWRVLTQEELDAQRQAMVEQFRAEMSSSDEQTPTEKPVRDVLPTAAAPVEAAPVDEERDDELLRLQQLLGLMGAKPAEAEAEGAAADDKEDEQEKVEAEPVDLEADGAQKVDEED